MTSSGWLDEQFCWIFDTNLSEFGNCDGHSNKTKNKSKNRNKNKNKNDDVPSKNIFDLLHGEINEQFCWDGHTVGVEHINPQISNIFDTNLSELGSCDGHSNKNKNKNNDVPSTNVFDQFCWDGDSKLSEGTEYINHQISDIFSGNIFDPLVEKLNDFFMWSDDSELFEKAGCSANSGNIFDPSFEHPLWVDDSQLSRTRCSRGHQTKDNCSGNIFEQVFEKLNEIFLWSDDSQLNDPIIENLNEQFFWDDDTENTKNECTLPAQKLFDRPCEPGKLKRGKKKEELKREDDDVYLSCRKEAFEMIGIATRHSKAAKDASLRGDHTSAKQFSGKAREAWKDAHRLNAEAAHKILRIKNKKNGIMKLDLHGLHASEAIQAVKKRLSVIESKSKALNASRPDGCSVGKPLRLEVITGVGKHSRGVATLPTAVRTFLADKGYQFDDGRPGVVMVRPKFRAI